MMTLSLRIFIYALYLAGIVLLMVFSGDKPAWISGTDPAIKSGEINNNTDNSFIICTLVFLVIVFFQGLMFIKTSARLEKFLAPLLLLLFCWIWLGA